MALIWKQSWEKLRVDMPISMQKQWLNFEEMMLTGDCLLLLVAYCRGTVIM